MHPSSDHPQCQHIKGWLGLGRQCSEKGWLVELDFETPYIMKNAIVVTTTYGLVS